MIRQLAAILEAELDEDIKRALDCSNRTRDDLRDAALTQAVRCIRHLYGISRTAELFDNAYRGGDFR